MIENEKNSLMISAIISSFLFILLMIMAFVFHIKPGTYSMTETSEYFIVTSGMINTQNFYIPIDNSLQMLLIQSYTKNIDMSWGICIFMFVSLIFIALLTKGEMKNIKKYIGLISIITLLFAANLIRVFSFVSYLTNHLHNI